MSTEQPQFHVEEIDPRSAVLHVRGHLDALWVDMIEPAFTDAVAQHGRHTAVDLHGVGFIASMGVQMLIAAIAAARRKGLRVVLFGAQPMVHRVLDHAAFERIAPMVADRDAALALLTTPA